jgi:hypothetical protein
MSNSDLSNRRVRSLPKKMTLSAQPHFWNLSWVSGMDLRLLYVQYLAHDDHQNLNFLLRLREPGNNCSNFIEYLVPTL